MYLRPESFAETFLVEESRVTLDEYGNMRAEFVTSGTVTGIISSVNPNEAEKLHGLKHTCTHKLVQQFGGVRARVGDRLIKADKIYFVEAVNNANDLGLFYIYYLSQRSDVK